MHTGSAASSINVDHRISNAAVLGVEADNEPGGHENPGGVDLVNAFGDAASRVLLLPSRNERIGIRGFDPDEDR